MTAPAAAFVPDRRVALGALAVRPVLYRGVNGASPFGSPEQPIMDLLVQSTSSVLSPTFHPATHVYGFVDLLPVPAEHRIQITDPLRRYLPRAVTAQVPDRRPLGAALIAGATDLPTVLDPPTVVALMRPTLRTPITTEETAVWGVTSAQGAALPFTWIRATTPQGTYVTYSDVGGEYLVSLSFLRPVLPANAGADTPATQNTFSVQIEAYALLAPPAPGDDDPLASFPADFDDLAPGGARFIALYGATALTTKTLNIQVGTQVRLDLQPA